MAVLEQTNFFSSRTALLPVPYVLPELQLH